MSDFAPGPWKTAIDVSDFIQRNYTRYEGNESFLAKPTQRTLDVWKRVFNLMQEEHKTGVLGIDTKIPSSILSHEIGFIDKDNELIVGLQNTTPLVRNMMPNGGIKLVERAAKAYGYDVDPTIKEIFTKYRKSHNDGVFSAYTKEQRLLRSKHVLTGLPDNYSRGRIIGDYRRVALYGIDRLLEDRQEFLEKFSPTMTEENIRLREEIWEQVQALTQIKELAKMYGHDISKPAQTFKEAVQWIYFGYLAVIKQQDGAAMSIGRLDAFLDIYAERDLKAGIVTEEQLQEIVDDFVIKLRAVRFLRTPEYNQLFAGDPNWVTLTLSGSGVDGRSMVTKTSFRFLHTLTNLGPAPEPNLTVLWSKLTSESWKNYCAKQSIAFSSIQYENDDLMKKHFGDDYAIACCVSAMKIGKDMQLFGARANIAKALLLAINGGREEPLLKPKNDEPKDMLEDIEYTDGGDTIIPGLSALTGKEHLDFTDVWPQFLQVLDWLAERYVNTMNVIHYMHDKYHYESAELGLHDPEVRRLIAFGAAGLSIVADSLSAIKYAKVKPILNSKGVAERYEINGDFPKYGNNDPRVDLIAKEVTRHFIEYLRKYPTYRNSVPTLSILTITSNVVYGSATGATPDGRASGMPFAPGANPMHGRDSHGAVASLSSVATLRYEDCMDGISNTSSFIPESLGKSPDERVQNLVQLMNGYFIGKDGHHLNVNVLNRETLLDAQQHPERYPQLTIRVSGYAVIFNNLNKKQQDEVIARTFHTQLSSLPNKSTT